MQRSKASKLSRTTAPIANASTTARSYGDIRVCLITICLTPFRLNIFRPFSLDYIGRPAWAGLLLDSACLGKEQPFIPLSEVFTGDDSLVGRDWVVGSLEGAAFREGFTQCEVRNYFCGLEDRYETIFNGPLYEDNAA